MHDTAAPCDTDLLHYEILICNSLFSLCCLSRLNYTGITLYRVSQKKKNGYRVNGYKTVITSAIQLKFAEHNVKVLNDTHTKNQVNRIKISMILRLMKRRLGFGGVGGIRQTHRHTDTQKVCAGSGVGGGGVGGASCARGLQLFILKTDLIFI